MQLAMQAADLGIAAICLEERAARDLDVVGGATLRQRCAEPRAHPRTVIATELQRKLPDKVTFAQNLTRPPIMKVV
jgi:hypothetical protein